MSYMYVSSAMEMNYTTMGNGNYTTVQNGSAGVVIDGTTYTHAANGIGAQGAFQDFRFLAIIESSCFQLHQP